MTLIPMDDGIRFKRIRVKEIQKILKFIKKSSFYNVSEFQFIDYKNKTFLTIPRDLPAYIRKPPKSVMNNLSILHEFKYNFEITYTTTLVGLKKLKSKKQMLKEFENYLKKTRHSIYTPAFLTQF